MSSITSSLLSTQDAKMFSQSEGLINKPNKTNDPKKAWEAAQDFEVMFISHIIQDLFQESGKDGLFGGGDGEVMFRTFFAEAIAKSCSPGFGVAEMVVKNLLEEGAENPSLPSTSLQHGISTYQKATQEKGSLFTPGTEIHNVAA